MGKALAGLEEDPRRAANWRATIAVDACAFALGKECQEEIGLDYHTFHMALTKLAAAIEAGKCDEAYVRERGGTRD